MNALAALAPREQACLICVLTEAFAFEDLDEALRVYTRLGEIPVATPGYAGVKYSGFMINDDAESCAELKARIDSMVTYLSTGVGYYLERLSEVEQRQAQMVEMLSNAAAEYDMEQKVRAYSDARAVLDKQVEASSSLSPEITLGAATTLVLDAFPKMPPTRLRYASEALLALWKRQGGLAHG